MTQRGATLVANQHVSQGGRMGDTTGITGQVRMCSDGELAGRADPIGEHTGQEHDGLIHTAATSGSGPSRPKGAPAYYLGRPAHVWISATGHTRQALGPAGDGVSGAGGSS
jgi:hypothetical protein